MIGYIFLLFIVGCIVVHFYQVISAIGNYFFKDFINRHLVFRNLNPTFKTTLTKYFTYYKNLKAEDKLLFERRVQKFIDMKEFVPRGELKEVTSEMKVLIAASAVQITFGLPGMYFSHFWKILLYDDNYYSRITQHYHQGEVNTRGFIVLSWRNFLNGYLNDNDGRNLGLHEMAHALKIADAIQNEDYDIFDTDVMNRFIKHGRIEIQKILDGGESMFRDYAATNDHEFFAVCIENFFERPAAFANYHPILYHSLIMLLQQNPLVYHQNNTSK